MPRAPNPKRGWSESAVCQCWIQCREWPEKRLLVGRRVTREGEMFQTYYGVLTNLTAKSLGVADPAEFARKVWRLYDAKGRMELSYKELLSDLNLHHPPCRQHVRNAGFYALATLAHTLGVGVKLIGGRSDDDKRRERTKARRADMPGRVSRHARRLHLTFLGVSDEVQAQFERWHHAICRC